MAVDVCSEISSPRISFSHDVNEFDSQNPRSDFDSDHPTIDFDFCVAGFPSHEISPADELFANGKILPVQIKEVSATRPKPDPIAHRKTLATETAAAATNKKRLIEFLSAGVDEDEEEDQEKSPPRAFWQFRRSSSDNSRANGLLRSLQFLTRSNSTGSVPNRKPHPKGIQKQHSLKETSTSISHHHHHHHHRPNSSINAHSYYPYYNNGSTRKPPLRKSSSSRSYGAGNGVRVNPVLNFPPSYIAKGTVSFFGFGSLFCSKKLKKRK